MTKLYTQFQFPLLAMPLPYQVTCLYDEIILFLHLPFSGNHGVVTLLSPATRSSIGCITCNGSVRACSFTTDGSKLLCSGNEGLVWVTTDCIPFISMLGFVKPNRYIWDVGTRRCIGKFADDGSTGNCRFRSNMLVSTSLWSLTIFQKQ